MYPRLYRTLLPHWLKRFAFFMLGIFLLYAPFALLTRLLLAFTNVPANADVHSVCLRMPIQWLAQPWMYITMLEKPVYLVAVFILPVLALFLGPLFCGWLCPAGGMTEYLSRLVPPRFQINLTGKVNPVPIRYGFMLGMIGVAFVGGNACCSFCNFTHAQNLINALFGNTLGLQYWASFMIGSFILWFFILGIFTRGGRGWCNFLCPAGALMGLAHWAGTKFKVSRYVRIDESACNQCGLCSNYCPTLAIQDKGEGSEINAHACNICMDCKIVCPNKAISYSIPLAMQTPSAVRSSEVTGD